jgi:chromosome segregation ATPase
MKNSFNKKDEIYKITKYQTKLAEATTREQQDLYRFKIAEHMGNLAKLDGIMTGGAGANGQQSTNQEEKQQQPANPEEQQEQVLPVVPVAEQQQDQAAPVVQETPQPVAAMEFKNWGPAMEEMRTQRTFVVETLKNLKSEGDRVSEGFTRNSTEIESTISGILAQLARIKDELSRTMRELSDKQTELDKLNSELGESISKGRVTEKDAADQLSNKINELKALQEKYKQLEKNKNDLETSLEEALNAQKAIHNETQNLSDKAVVSKDLSLENISKSLKDLLSKFSDKSEESASVTDQQGGKKRRHH